MTKQRKAIIDLFKENSGKALSAEMMYHLVGDDKMNLSTVYRTMDKLLEAKLINKTVVNTVAYFYLAESEHNHFMICTNCQKMIPIGCIIKKFLPDLATQNHFKITGHDITIFGLCEECI
jgi:Fur family ferric uptake transcriptional regulator